MKYKIEYGVVCHKGFLREKNQDNFWCSGVFLPPENDGLLQAMSGVHKLSERPVFAVFDGMGGEIDGEWAAWAAANRFNLILTQNKIEDPLTALNDISLSMNEAVCTMARERHARRMGTTSAIINFSNNGAYISNLGDSRIYLHRSGALTQISLDHTSNRVTTGKPPLTQHLGVISDEYQIMPYQNAIEFKPGDRYLLCSDGVTDMLTDIEITNILSQNANSHTTVEWLLEGALSAGGKDNITAILCDVVETKGLL